MKKRLLILGVILACLAFSSCDLLANIVTEVYLDSADSLASEVEEEASSSEEEPLEERIRSVRELERTEHFAKSSLTHIFEGEINGKGQAVGYHSEAIEDTAGETIEGTQSKPNAQGVYTAQVKVDGVKKSANKGYSTFFPEEWTAQEVVDAINEAYENRQFDNGNTYLGESDDGIIIQLYLTGNDKIISAFPIY